MSTANLLRQPSSPEQLQQFAEGGFLYAITDGADEPLLRTMIPQLGQLRACPVVAAGTPEQELTPYVVAVDPMLLDWLRRNVWSKPWGVFVLAESDLASLAQHFARFLLITLPDGENWFFRFYDPRLLQVFLPNCSAEELSAFCAPVRAFAIPSGEGGEIEIMRYVPGSGESAAEAEVQQAVPTPGPAAEEVPSGDATAAPRAAVPSFDDRVAEHLHEFFPEQCQHLGADGLKQAIDYGIGRAASYGLETERDIGTFLELMFTFGVDFDTQLSWATAILNDAAVQDPSHKIEALFQEAARHVQRAMQNAKEVSTAG
jgi:hypothetical protein